MIWQERHTGGLQAEANRAILARVLAVLSLVLLALGCQSTPSGRYPGDKPAAPSQEAGASWALALTDIRVIDGDTVAATIVGAASEERIRLAGIDAPEMSQSGGPEASIVLAAFLATGDVTLVGDGRDKYGRLIGDLYVGERSVSWSLVRSGHAWWYEKYSSDAELGAAQEQAVAERAGLWAASSPIAPWEYRSGKRVGAPPRESVAPTAESEPANQATVFVTKTGKKYHRETCRFVQQSKIAIDRGEAEAKFGPCKVCQP